jgi:hypothetical protein
VGTALLVGTLLVAPGAFAFKVRWHKAILWSALSFVKADYRNEMAAVQDNMDGSPWYGGRDIWHFNDCDFSGASSNINDVYGDVLAALRKKDAAKAAKLFGRILHTAQDFYAHTNWVDLKIPDQGQKKMIADANPGLWKEMKPWEPLWPQGVVPVSDKSDRPANVTLISTEPPNREHLRVRIGATEYPALISGAATLRMNCPKEATIGHWDGKEQSGGLSKDYPCRDPAKSFQAACSMALRQTYQEWCRLKDLATADKDATAKQTLEGMVEDSVAARDKESKICSEKKYLEVDFGGCQ